MTKRFVNTFLGGIDRDTSSRKYSNTNVLDSVNFTLMSDRKLSNQALISIQGSLAKASISGEDVFIKGHLNLRDFVILFVKTPTAGKIYKFKDFGSNIPESGELVLIYEDENLFKDTDNEIIGVGRYETEDVQKIYFTDRETFLYHLNIVHNEDTNPLSGLNKIGVNSMEFVSDVKFEPILYSLGDGGALKSGRIQYAYQFYNANGSETGFSPTSPLINLTDSDENSNSTLNYLGTKQDVTVSKHVNLTISITDSSFIRVRVVAIQYESDIVEPSVRVVGEYNIKDLEVFTLTDAGQTIGTLTLDEFRFIQNDFIPKTIETKDNILFAGGLTTQNFYVPDEVFDARAFRFNPSRESVLDQGEDTQHIVDGTDIANTLPPKEHNCYNVFNNLKDDRYRFINNPFGRKSEYRYKADGTTLGGEGLHVSYEFITLPKVIDTEPMRSEVNILRTPYGYPKQIVKVDAPFDNYANYITAAEYVGYQRDEIYAFAIVFFDKKGRQSFAKWIGDIRFPDNNTHPFISYDSSNNHTIANILGINFSITIPQELRDLGITSYQIVRCERRDTSKTVKAAGIYGYPYTKSTETNSNKMYCTAAVPTIGDCQNRKINTSRWSYDLNSVADGKKISEVSTVQHANNELSLTDRFIEFSSPEISFNKRLDTNSADIVEINGGLNFLSFTAIQDVRCAGVSRNRAQMVSDKYKNFIAYPANKAPNFNLPFSRVKVGTSRVFTQIDSQFTPPYVFPDGKIYSRQTHNGKGESDAKGNRHFGLRGSHLFASVEPLNGLNSLHLPDDYAGKGNGYDHRVMYGYYRQDVGKGIYGGTDYSARTARTYYKASDIISIDKNSTTIQKSEVIEIPPPDPETAPTIGYSNITVSFKNNYPSNGMFVIEITLPEPAVVETSFWINWEAERIDYPSGITTWGAAVVIEQGQLSGSLDYITEIKSPDENWQVTKIEIGNMSPPNQFIISEEINSGSATQEPTYEVIITEEEIPGIVVFGGDTYIGYHIDNRSLWDFTRGENPGRWSIKNITMYPVESTINLSLRTDDIQGFITWHAHVEEKVPSGGQPVNAPKYHLQERLVQGIQMWGADYPVEFGDMYQYNKAYSALDKSKIFVPEPFDFKDRDIFDTRVHASDVKINGEYRDSWLFFKSNSYIDVDSAYGQLMRLLNVANRLLFFQRNGLGVLSVNERALVEDNNVGKLTLGSGGILPRFDYISYNTGITDYNAVIKADSTFYYIDSERKRIYTHEGQDVPVSMLKNINSKLQDLEFSYINTGFDPKYNRIYFTIDNSTFVFNEFYKAFTHRIQLVPSRYITLKNNLYTVRNYSEAMVLTYNDETIVEYDEGGTPVSISDSDKGTTIFKHNVSSTGILDEYENTDESFVELLINPEQGRRCAFTNLEFDMEVIDNNCNIVFQDTDEEKNPSFQPIFETVKQVVFSNSYIDPVTVDIVYGKNIKKIGKVWRMQVPLVPDRKVPSRTVRFVDSYLKVKIIFDNSKTNRLRLHDIITYYTPITV